MPAATILFQKPNPHKKQWCQRYQDKQAQDEIKNFPPFNSRPITRIFKDLAKCCSAWNNAFDNIFRTFWRGLTLSDIWKVKPP